jgi:hypothetical protein
VIQLARELDVAGRSGSIRYIDWWQDLVIHEGHIFKNGYLTFQDKRGYRVELNPDVTSAHLAPGETGGSEVYCDSDDRKGRQTRDPLLHLSSRELGTASPP